MNARGRHGAGIVLACASVLLGACVEDAYHGWLERHPEDGGARADAGQPAGDAGEGDAGRADAGAADAGARPDGGTDAGPPVDAGSKPLGASCSGDLECAQLHCVAGECCDSACTGTCGRCDSFGHCGDCTGACVVSYRDQDGDGFGSPNGAAACSFQPLGYVLDNTDCCDLDARAHPGQTSYFASRNACGSFDYDCSGTEDLEYVDAGGCAQAGTVSCTMGWFCIEVQGWSTEVPSCGDAGVWISSCNVSAGCTMDLSATTCGTPTAGPLIQGCR